MTPEPMIVQHDDRAIYHRRRWERTERSETTSASRTVSNIVAAQEPPDILDINIAQRPGQQGPGPACEPFWRRLIQQLQNSLIGGLRIDPLPARSRARLGSHAL